MKNNLHRRLTEPNINSIPSWNDSMINCGIFLDPTYVNLSDAVKFGDLESIKVAINNGTPINQRDKYYKTPLMIACLYGKIKVAQALLDMG
jgi:ankyrin repeat protein